MVLYTHTTHKHVQVWAAVTKEAPAAALALDGAEVKAVHQHRVTLCPESFTVTLLFHLRRTSCAAAAAATGSCGGAWLAEGRSLSHNGAGVIGDEGSAVEGNAALVAMLSPPAIGGNDRHQVGSSVAL